MNDALDLLGRYEFEFPMLLNRSGAFEEGYHNYLKSNEIVNLDDEHLSDAKTYIKQHLQGEVGLWTEREVNDKLKDWKLSLTPMPTPAPSTPFAQPKNYPPFTSTQPSNVNEPSTGFGQAARLAQMPEVKCSNASTKHQQALEHIDNIHSLATAQRLLEQLCDLGYEDILDIILDN